MGVSIMLGEESITPGRRSRMAEDLDAHFSHQSRNGSFILDHDDIPVLTKLVVRGGLHDGEDRSWRDPEVSSAYRAIIKEIHERGIAIIRLLY